MTTPSAVRRRGLLRSRLPWLAMAYLLSGVPVGMAVLAVLVTLVLVGVVSAVVLVGIPLLLAVGLLGLPVGAIERRRLRLIGAGPVADPHRVPDRPGLRAWLAQRYGEPATWRDLAYTVLLATVLWPLDLLVAGCLFGVPGALLSAPGVQAIEGEVKLVKAVMVTSPGPAWLAAAIGVAVLVPACYLITGYAWARAALARALLTPRGEQVVELARSRARLVDAFDAERRRIERDLHDGAQQRLVALGMILGVARLADPAELPELVERAHDQAGRALDDLRELIQGIHPRVLTDRGLPAAVAEVADRSPIPVEVDVTLPRRLSPSVEATAYFVVSEALTNVAKHSGASRASVTGRLVLDRLVMEVHDDGAGGADPRHGSGLTGLSDRVSVADGRLALSSPPGGPTLLRVELPCAQIDRFG